MLSSVNIDNFTNIVSYTLVLKHVEQSISGSVSGEYPVFMQLFKIYSRKIRGTKGVII